MYGYLMQGWGLVVEAFEPALGIDRSLAAGTSSSDCLAVVVIDNISAGKYARDCRDGRIGFGD